MDRKVVDFSLRSRFLVLLGVFAIIGFGIYEYRQLPVDAFPDISPIMVPVFTDALGMAPEEVERLITFPIESATPGSPPRRAVGGPPIELGDIFIAPSVVRRNAERHNVPFEDELALMVVHGILHLLGWDHEREDEAVRMERRESELLARIGRVRP